MFLVDSNNNITLTRGDSASLCVDLYDANGDQYVLKEGDYIVFSMAADYDTAAILKKVSASPSIALTPADTQELAVGVYLYDIAIRTSSGNVYTPIGVSKFIITSNIDTTVETAETKPLSGIVSGK